MTSALKIPTISPKHQFDVLHGMRGVAAVLVMVSHLQGYFRSDFAPSSHLAVDLFFLLSGFVISHAYDIKFVGGMKVGSFMKARLIRLYPLYLFSLIVRAAAAAATISIEGIGAYSRIALVSSFASAAFFLPTPAMLSTIPKYVFPLNVPTWSLFYEIIINLAFAAFSLNVGKKTLSVILALSAVGLAYVAFEYHLIDGGSKWSQFGGGIPRIMFSFSAGVFLKRYIYHPPNSPSLPTPLKSGTSVILLIAVAFLLICSLAVPMSGLYDFVIVVFVWPAVVLVGAYVAPGRLLQSVYKLSGDASYGIYILHAPMVDLAALLMISLAGFTWADLGPAFGYFASTFVICASVALHFWFDQPVRRTLSRHFERRSKGEVVTQF